MKMRLIGIMCLLSAKLLAQTVQPVIAEYKSRGEGKFMVTNNTLAALVVLLEPKSFDITPEGRGLFRPLDKGIRVELSSTSLKLAPHQTAYVFYKADAEVLPAWFTVYATFSQPQHGTGLDVRIMLPHTVYLYQKDAMQAGDIEIIDATYSMSSHKLICNLINYSKTLGRVQSVKASTDKESADANGFPMLPGRRRQVEMEWKGKEPPREIYFQFEHFYTSQYVSVSQ
jgi:hypothetical protein